MYRPNTEILFSVCYISVEVCRPRPIIVQVNNRDIRKLCVKEIRPQALRFKIPIYQALRFSRCPSINLNPKK